MSFRLVAVQMRYISEQSNKIDNYDPKRRCMRWSAVLLKVSELQNGGHPPSWIGCTPIWTTHEEYLVVFIIVQNLVGIKAVVSIIQKFYYFAWLA